MNQRKIGVAISYLNLAFNIVVGLVYTPFMIAKLGDGEYGIFTLCNSLISLVTLLDLGFGQTLVRYISKTRANNDKDEEHKLNGLFIKLYSSISVLALIIGIGIILFYPQLAQKSFSPEEMYLFRTVFCILLVNVVISFPLSVFSATLNAYEQFFFLKSISFLMNVLKYLAMFLLLVYGHKLIAIAIVTLCASIITQTSYVIYAVKKIGIKFDFSKIDTDLSREITHFSFFIFLNLIIDFLYSNTDNLILGVVAGTVAVSIYSIGVYFSQFFGELSNAMSGVFLPKIMYLYEKKDMHEISNLFNRVGRLQMVMLFLFLGGYFCLGKEFISLWVGPTYRDSYIIGVLIMLPSIIPLTQNIGISVLRAMNIHKYRSYMYIVIAIINVIISVPLSMKFQGIGAAFGTFVGTLLGQILFMNWFYARRVHINIKEYWMNFKKFFIISVITGIIVFGIKSYLIINSWFSFSLIVLVYSIIYFILYWCLIANSYEKSLILNLAHVKRG